MEEKKQIDDMPDLPTQGSGSILAAARKRQNKTVEEIASELNLSISQIRTIELDQSDGLPEPTYVRGYIRSYAKLLGLKSEDVLQNYLNPNWQQSTNLSDMPKGIGSAEETSSSKFLTPTKIVTLLLLAGTVFYLWFSGFFSPVDDANVSVNETPAITDSVENVESPASTDPTQGAASESSEIAADTDVAAASTETPAAGVNNELLLNFSQTSWVDIRDKDDNRLAYRSYTAGEELIVASEGPMSVFIGNAEGVSVQYNGAEFDISKYREGVYAKFVVSK